MQPTSDGEIERARVSDATVGRPYDLLRRPGTGDLHNKLLYVDITYKKSLSRYSMHLCLQAVTSSAVGPQVCRQRQRTNPSYRA